MEAMMLDRIVEVFCEVDDFCQAFVPQWEASLLGPDGPARRGPQPGLSTSEIITLLLVLHSSGFKYLKSFYHGFAEPLLGGYFPGMPLSLSRLNPWLPRGQVDPEVMQGTADFHHAIPDALLPQADPVFDHAITLDTAVDRLN